MFKRFLFKLALFIADYPKVILWSLVALVVAPFIGIIGAKIYQSMDRDPDRGAVAIAQGTWGETYGVPEYLDQGWSEAQSLWFYNTTQGSAFMPYDFLLALEQTDLQNKIECDRDGKTGAWFLCDRVVDGFRYLPQKKTLFNPDALPVGFVKEPYQGKDYVGYTCAACHTAQVNFKGRALRIDGGPAMGDMIGFLIDLTEAMRLTQRTPDQENPRLDRFIARVLELNNDYNNAAEVEADLNKWTDIRTLYNVVNRSTKYGKEVEYGYARLDAFGRIYNRVLQHAISRNQVGATLKLITVMKDGSRQQLVSDAEIEQVLRDVPDQVILQDHQFWKIITNLQSTKPGYPGLDDTQMLDVRDALFNSPNAPVSYPFLWDITHSDYVQWNGLASNVGLGPLGRNTGEVIGVFAILDWHQERGIGAWFRKFSLAAILSGQGKKKKIINFQSSVDLFNLGRLESHLTSLMSPRWPFCKNAATGEYYLPTGPENQWVDQRACSGRDQKIDQEMADKGQRIYAKMCEQCHVLIDREAWDRLVVGKLLGIDSKQSTDKTDAKNGVNYKGKSGNFKDTYQKLDIGTVVVAEEAPVVQILIAATTGVVATPDADKWWPRRMVEWIYTLFKSFADNPIKSSVKAGDYMPDTTAEPYNSLLAYRARSLDGIWATAPYLHNGSVPTLWDLLLPQNPIADKCPDSRPKTFKVGKREFDPKNVGFVSQGYDGFEFDTDIHGNGNMGHEYGACGLSDEDRWNLIEYLKSL